MDARPSGVHRTHRIPFVNPVTRDGRSRFTVGMSNNRAYDDIHDPADLAALQQQEAERAQAEKIAADNTAAGDTGDTGDSATADDSAGEGKGRGNSHGTTVAGDSDGVEGTDPDLTVPGESDTAGSGGQGADDRYTEGDLGGGAIGGAVENEEKEAR